MNRPFLSAFYLLIVVSVVIWVHIETPGLDVHVYYSAIQSLAAAHDPYTDAMAIHSKFQGEIALHPNEAPPNNYVYPPLTLPLLRLAGGIPAWLSATLYWSVYIASVLTQIRVTRSAVTETERPYFLFVAAVAPFFPGLIATDNILSGNVAYILYALAFIAAIDGWRNARWGWFYLVVLADSCVKAPFLSLVLIPALSHRKQWLPTGLTVLAGLGLYAAQFAFWPDLFHHYLQAVEQQISSNRDFGNSPAGLFCGFLYDRGVAYSTGGLIFFLCYALPLLAALFSLSRLFLQGRFTLAQWMPVLLVGVILLNPRIIEYDVAPLTIPLALIGWRFLTAVTSPKRSIVLLAVIFVLTNALGLYSYALWKMTEGSLLVVFFLAGSWTLALRSRASCTEEILVPA